jgi:two-component system, OmpR family, response regulator
MAAAATALRTLIVEDDPDSSQALARALQLEGFETDIAATVGQALIKLEKGLQPDAIIVDLKLPDASGGLLLRRVRRYNLPIKIAVVTGMPDPNSHMDVNRFPPDRIFKKPLDFAQLVEWLKSVT